MHREEQNASKQDDKEKGKPVLHKINDDTLTMISACGMDFPTLSASVNLRERGSTWYGCQ